MTSKRQPKELLFGRRTVAMAGLDCGRQDESARSNSIKKQEDCLPYGRYTYQSFVEEIKEERTGTLLQTGQAEAENNGESQEIGNESDGRETEIGGSEDDNGGMREGISNGGASGCEGEGNEAEISTGDSGSLHDTRWQNNISWATPFFRAMPLLKKALYTMVPPPQKYHQCKYIASDVPSLYTC